MTVRIKIFLLLSLILFSAIMLYVWIYAGMDKQRMMASLEQSSEQKEQVFRAEQDSAAMRMLQIATFVAHDPKVQQMFLLGKHAVELEGGGAGGELSAQVRSSLYEHIRQSQEVLEKQFGFRQLQFLFGPGALSFLRVHRPEKFGDRMDEVRYTIVAVNAEQKNIMGFETGRSASGIRGATPVYAFDAVIKEKVFVGALEAGTSFATMLSIFYNNFPWLNAAVLLNQEHLQAKIDPEPLKKILKESPFIGGFRIEGTSSSKIEDFLARKDFSNILISPGHHLLSDGETHYSFTSFPLRDFHGETDPDQPDVGLVIIWKEIGAEIAAYHDRVSFLIFYGFLLFLGIEIFIFFALKLMTSQLQKELLKTQKQEVETRQARLVAEESSRLKTQFLSNMSHELRTPMNAIMGLGQLLSDTPLDHCQQNFIDKINVSSKSLMNMINEVLLVAEVDAQRTEELSHEHYSPVQLVNRMVKKFIPKAKDQGVNLKIEIVAGLPSKVDGYSAQLEQVLGQLLGNAIKFSHDGDITLSLRLLDRTDDNVILEYAISDQGIGISPEQQQQIFESFYQVDGSKTRESGGTGLGLTIARKVCRQLGGDIVVESTLGQGSRFSFQLKYKVHTESLDRSVTALSNTVMAVTEEESVTEPIMGTFSEVEKFLQRLEEPLAKMQPQPCQEIAAELEAKQWPESLTEDIEELISLIGKYRFVEGQVVVERLKRTR